MNIVSAVIEAQYQSTLNWAKETTETDDQLFVENNGAPTSRVAQKLGLSVFETRKQLNKAARQGVVVKSSANRGRVCRWWPAGYLAVVKGEVKHEKEEVRASNSG